MNNKIENIIRDSQSAIGKIPINKVQEAADEISSAFERGNKLLICGNGGSAADSQHFAAELVGRFEKEKQPLPAISLTTDTSILTAVANDYGYDDVFAKQVKAIGEKGDILFAISTSGNSPNVLKAVEFAKEIGMKSVSLTGKDGGKIARISDIDINIPVFSTARVQEAHITVIHIICKIVEDKMLAKIKPTK
ncbi:D-sedoheptulose 7-phosphate isomerase [bacterium]|nr:MAG: D-sedoheptulose 7-phosphate isomerase [bacterium]